MKKNNSKAFETCLVISTAFLIFFLKTENMLFVYLAIGISAVGILIRPLARLIARGWFALGEMLGKISSTIILSIVYYLILFPVAAIYKLSNRKALHLKNPNTTLWHQREHQYDSEDLKNAW